MPVSGLWTQRSISHRRQLALAFFAADAREPEEVVFPLQDGHDQRRFDRFGGTGDASKSELLVKHLGDFVQRAGLHSKLAFGFQDQIDEFPRELVALVLELLPDPLAAWRFLRTTRTRTPFKYSR